MWILFIAIVIGYLVFSSIHDHNKDVKTNVTDHGGMLVKYKVLIDYFTSSKINNTDNQQFSFCWYKYEC